MKKILVAGAGGFIAGELVKKLKEQGHGIVAVDKKPLQEYPISFQKIQIFRLQSTI